LLVTTADGDCKAEAVGSPLPLEEVAMAHANSIFAGLDIRLPYFAMPKLRRPRLSQRARALLMMGLMVSPVFLTDEIGYGVQRLFMTADQIAVRQAPDSTMLSRVTIFHVACVNANAPASERARWAKYSAQRGWPLYPQAGVDCFQPDQNLYGIAGLTAFNVACPSTVLSVADHRR